MRKPTLDEHGVPIQEKDVLTLGLFVANVSPDGRRELLTRLETKDNYRIAAGPLDGFVR
jgi:hypothetical protein